MIRKLLIASVSLAAVALGGCSKTFNADGTFTPVVISIPVGNPTVDKIVNGVRMACGFVPAVSTVVDILATFTGGGAIANIGETVINGICNSLKAKGVRRGTREPVYRGVVIRGTRA